MKVVTHHILQLWSRPIEAGAVQPQPTLQLDAGKGVVGDHTYGRHRHVTIIFRDDWQRAEDELGRAVDPVGRRANVLVSGGDGKRLIGKRVRLGTALVEIKGETAPCPVMDQAATGMMQALKPDARAGIWGRVLEGGTIRPEDALVEAD